MRATERSRTSAKRPTIGTLLIIGGHEDKEGRMRILREVAARVGKGKLCIATVASRMGEVLWNDYRKVFRKLGVRHLSHLYVAERNHKKSCLGMRAIRDATAVFFTGGDQLKITSKLGGTRVADRIMEIYLEGGLIAGTSAGASVMSETMLVSGPADSSCRIGSMARMAPGLGFVRDVIIDQHFAQRGRVGRLIGAVAQNPKFIGIGIDENTSVLIEGDQAMQVLGEGAVYVFDAHGVTESNVSEVRKDDVLSIFNLSMHILSEGDWFDRKTRRPFTPRKDQTQTRASRALPKARRAPMPPRPRSP